MRLLALFIAISGIASAQSTGDYFHQLKTSGGRGEQSFTPAPSSLWGFDEAGAFTLVPTEDFAAAIHLHAFADLTGKPTTLAGYGITDAMSSTGTLALGGFGSITGILPPANLGTGSSITTKFLRGDGTWQTVSTTVDAAALIGSTLASGVTASSLTSLGTLSGLAVNSGTLTASAPVTLSQTWNNGAVTFSGLTFYVTDTASSGSSVLLEMIVGGLSQFKIGKNSRVGFTNYTGNNTLIYGTQNGGVYFGDANGNSYGGFTSNTLYLGGLSDILLTRNAAAWIRQGAASATPIAQTYSGADGSGTNIAGGNMTLASGRGTGTAAGGDLIIGTSGTGSSGSSLNALVTRLTIKGGTGYIIPVLPTSSAGLPTGALWNDAGTVKVAP